MKTTLEAINAAAKNPDEFARQCDGEYVERISLRAKTIAENGVRVCAIAGPSASGKTTSAHILKRELIKLGKKTEVVSLDDFYKPHSELPLMPDGSYDFESVNSLDTELIKECLESAFYKGETKLPKYNFKTHLREEGESLSLGNDGIMIIEGLHALNPQISGFLPRDKIAKFYISVNLPIEDDDGIELLSSRQVRLVRRVLRDEKFRGAKLKDTLFLWDNVNKGEVKYLYPYKETADYKLSTLHPFELCVYRERFCRLRHEIDRNMPWYDYFIKTVNALELFESMNESAVPENSLIREFIG